MAVDMHARGETVRAIAKKTKMTESGVYQLLRRAKNKNVALDRPVAVR